MMGWSGQRKIYKSIILNNKTNKMRILLYIIDFMHV